MTEPSSEHLRNRPRQARSAARVELLLDVAAEVFEEVGYAAATTNLVAARADVPVGTLYRWFPDKAALAEALADRYLATLLGLYEDLIGSLTPDERIGDFLHRVTNQLVAATREQRALPALLLSTMVPGSRANAGTRLRAGLHGHIRGLIDLRVPGLDDDSINRTADVMVSLAQLVLVAAADDDDDRRDSMTAEYVDVMLAYLEAKFPAADHHAWTDPDVVVKPLFPGADRASRLAAITE